jgi:tripartite-type tricarboxylate transporter receptor subunit TctC
VVFRESRVVDEVWAGVAPRALAGEALLIVLDNFEHAVVVASHAAWNGVGAPRNTPVEIIHKLNREINAALGDTNVKVRLADLGSTAFVGSPADFNKFIAEETEKWAGVIKFAGIKAV